MNVIVPVSKPTEWVSDMIAVERNNNIRICLDPTQLNAALIIPKFPIPTIPDIITQLSGKKIFTVLDVSKGFWHVKLDEKSSFYTTFQTPFGRFHYKQLCFGISPAPEIFMKKIIEIFGTIPNVHPYFDDIIIATSTKKEHDEVLDKVFQRAKEYNIKFNQGKLQFKQRKVKFLGVIISENTVQIDSDRIQAIAQMPRPTDKKSVFHFLGLVKYVSPFIPNATSATHHLRLLTHNNVPFSWTPDHEKEFQSLKTILCSNPVLMQFDANVPITRQTDSSKSGKRSSNFLCFLSSLCCRATLFPDRKGIAGHCLCNRKIS